MRGVNPIFTDPEALREQIDGYFDSLPKRKEEDEDQLEYWIRPPTLSGLAQHLNVTRRTLTNYISDYESGEGKRGKGKAAQCGELLIRAKGRIETYLEEELVTRPKTQGVQFALQNGYGWGAKNTVEVKGDMKTAISGEVSTPSTPISDLSDEELLEQMKIVRARLDAIMEREGIADGGASADG